ncbi:MAG: AAA family ATPase, partial [Bacteroidales bacterium]|nr:AAA family ATPase [Bacteroidales bacterium]
YVGYDEGGQLTEAVRRKPYSVVLLDEIEKAHPEVFNILLQILDDGRLTDNKGHVVNFKNTIIIMTSNLGSEIIYKNFENVEESQLEKVIDNTRNQVFELLSRNVRPEFLNRIDDVVLFNILTRDDIHKIIDIELKGLYGRINQLGYQIKLTDAAKDYIVEKGYDIQFGARPLKRAIQKYLEDPMAEVLISADIAEGDTISVGFNSKKEEITVKVQKSGKKPAGKAADKRQEEAG